MRVKVRAVVVQDGRLLVARDRHRGVDQLMLPGGRVHERESITGALIRGVADTARLAIDPVKLLYVVEIPGLYAAYDLTLVWLAELIEPAISLPEASLTHEAPSITIFLTKIVQSFINKIQPARILRTANDDGRVGRISSCIWIFAFSRLRQSG